MSSTEEFRYLVDRLPGLREEIRRALRDFNPEAGGLEMNRAANRLLNAVHRYDGAEIGIRRMEVEREEEG